MAEVGAKCTVCGEILKVDKEKDASICPQCGNAFVTEKAIRLYDGLDEEKAIVAKKRSHVWKSLGRGVLLFFECIGYLFYVLFFIWLFVDITDNLKNK